MAVLPEGPQAPGQILLIIDAIGDWFFAFFLGVAVIFVLLAALQFATEGGEPSKVAEARKRLLYAVVGIGLALIAGGIDNVLRAILAGE